MAVIRIETDQPISSITINFGGVVDGAAKVSVTEEPINERGNTVSDRGPFEPSAPDRPSKSGGWHADADDEISRALEAGNVEQVHNPEDEILDATLDGFSAPPPKVIEAPALPEKPAADRESSIDPGMAQASY